MLTIHDVLTVAENRRGGDAWVLWDTIGVDFGGLAIRLWHGERCKCGRHHLWGSAVDRSSLG